MKPNCPVSVMRSTALAVLAITAAAFVVACGGGDDTSIAQLDGIAQATGSTTTLETALTTIAPAALSTEEASSLIIMREEETLARDVYAAMFSLWGSGVFQNIGVSEQMHMDAVKLLLTRYALPDPAATTLPGQFGNTLLQNLYDTLLASGQTRLIDALKVGAEIEDLDIRDLRAIKATIDNADLLLVYENLEKGSRNHLRALHDNLLRQGATCTPKYITPAEYDATGNSPHKKEELRLERVRNLGCRQ